MGSGRHPALAALVLVALASAGARAEPLLTSGYYYRGPGVSLLEPCGSQQGYWVLPGGDARASLFPQYLRITRKDYERVFVTLRGELRALRPGEGVPPEYAGAFEVEATLVVRPGRAGDCR